jgi:hypothetical protein
MSVFQGFEKLISAENGSPENEHPLIMIAFEWVPIVPTLDWFYCKYK